MRDLYIIGSGGFGKEVAWLVERINKENKLWNLKGFIDDDENLLGLDINGIKVKGNTEYLNSLGKDVWAICAVGNAKARENIISRLNNISFATLIDPSVIISNKVKIGEGTIICAGSIITVDIEIGRHVIINLDCTIGHDDIIKDYVTIYPSVNVSGNVIVEEKCEIGTGTQIIQGKNIVSECIIGAGAVVVKDLVSPGTYVGIPAINIERKEKK